MYELNVHDFVKNYRFTLPDGRKHVPSEQECTMLEDAINAYNAAFEAELEGYATGRLPA